MTPGVKTTAREEDDPPQCPSDARTFKGIVAPVSFLARNFMDIQYAVKEAARGMALLGQSHIDKSLRIAKYMFVK